MLFWDKEQQSLIYYYFTTAGFYTQGTMTFDAKTKSLIAEEVVKGNVNGISKVRSTTKLAAGKLMTSAEYLQNGTWVKGHSAVYVEDKDATIQFK
jgi:xylose isomerase